MKRSPHRIVSLIVGFIIMLLAGVYYAWSLFRVELAGYFPTWSASAASMNFSLLVIMLCLGGLVGGRLTARIGQPGVARIGAIVMLAGGFLFRRLASMAPGAALAMLYISYGGLCGFGVGMVYNAVISSVSSLFPGAGGLASGTMLTGFGFGSLVTGGLVMRLAAAIGFFPAFLWCVVAVSVVSFAGSVCLRAAAPAPKSGDTPAADTGRDMPTAKVARTARFWLFFLWMLFMTSGGLMAINSAASIAVLFGAAAIVGMIVSVFNGVSRMGIGAFCDRFGSRASMIVANGIALTAGVLLLLASLTGITALMVLGLITAGVTYGCAMSLSAAVMREQFGNTHYASNFSLITLSGIPSSMLGPYVSGMLQDAFGGYRTTFIAMIAFAAVAALLLAALIGVIKKAGRA